MRKVFSILFAAFAVTALLFFAVYGTPKRRPPVRFDGEQTGVVSHLDIKNRGFYEAYLGDGQFRFSAADKDTIRSLEQAFVTRHPVKIRYVQSPSCNYYVPEVPFRAVQILEVD